MSALQEWKGLKQNAVRCRSRYPDVYLLVETGKSRYLLDALGRGALDLALILGSESPESRAWQSKCRGTSKKALVSHLRQAPRQCRFGRIAQAPLILFQQGSHLGNLVDPLFRRDGFSSPSHYAFRHAEAVKAMIRTGLGISMLPMWAVDTELKKQMLLASCVNVWTEPCTWKCRNPRLTLR
jgi:DNA-binding transcriptional LysR family regulator